MASSSSRIFLATAAVLAALLAGAWCAAPAKVSFTVAEGSGEKKLDVEVKYDREGDSMKEVELREHGSSEWQEMKKSEDGKYWEIQTEKPLKAPFNFRFLTEKGLKNVFDDVIPENYKIGTAYAPQEY